MRRSPGAERGPEQGDGPEPVVVDYVISVGDGKEPGTYPSSTFRFYRHRPEELEMLAEITTFSQPLLRIRRSR